MRDTLLGYEFVDPKAEKAEIGPGLAESYRVVNPTTTEIELRQGAEFRVGADIDAGVSMIRLIPALPLF